MNEGKVKTKSINSNFEFSDNGIISGVMTVEDFDREGDIIRVAGIDLTKYMLNPVVLLQHNSRDFPIGKGLEISHTMVGDKPALKFTAQIDLDDPNGKKAFEKIKKGYLKGISVGIQIKDAEFLSDDPWDWSMDIKQSELYEFSVVSVPANSAALIESYKSYGNAVEKDMEEVKSMLHEILTKLEETNKSKETEEPQAEDSVPEDTGIYVVINGEKIKIENL